MKEDYLRRIADDIVYLLHNKQSLLLGVKHSTRSVLTNIAEILQRDSTPTINTLVKSSPPTSPSSDELPSSDGVVSSTFTLNLAPYVPSSKGEAG